MGLGAHRNGLMNALDLTGRRGGGLNTPTSLVITRPNQLAARRKDQRLGGDTRGENVFNFIGPQREFPKVIDPVLS